MQKRDGEFPATFAYILPFALYVVLTVIESGRWLNLEYEVWCTLKGVLAAAALWTFRRQYPVFSTVGFNVSILAGALGCVVWIALERLQRVIPSLPYLTDLLAQGGRVEFDPYLNGSPSMATIA